MPIDTRIPTEEREIGIPSSLPPQLPGRENEVSLLDLLIILASKKWLIFKITAAFCILALLASLMLHKRYTATATVLPPQQNSSLASTLASQLGGSLGSLAALAGGGGQSLLKNPNDMYSAMFKSQTVEDGVIQNFGLMKEYKKKNLSAARKEFEHKFTVDGGGKDGLLHISVQDGDPKRAAELANGWISQFRQLTESLAITEASQRRLFFDGQMSQAKNNLANAEVALKQTEQATGLIEVNSQASALIQSAASLQAQIVAKQVQLQALRTYATNENSTVVEVQQELDSLQAQLAKLGGSSDVSAAGLIVPKGKVPEAGLEYVRKLRDVKYYETIFEIMARQWELAKVDEAKEGAVVQVIDPALPPDRKSFPKRTIIILVAMFFGLLVGVGVALAEASLERMEQDQETSEKLALLRRAIGLKKSRV